MFDRAKFCHSDQPSGSEGGGGINAERFLSAVPFQANRFALIPLLPSLALGRSE